MKKMSFLKKLFIVVLVMISIDFIVWLVIRPSDYMEVDFDKEFGLHLSSNQAGTFSYWPKKEVNGKYTVNNEGWNSVHKTFENRPNLKTIAIIGDSYVEGRHINIEESYPVKLESLLNKKEPSIVYPFSCSGWQAAQYLHVLPNIAEKHQPEVIVINVERNDLIDARYNETSNYGQASFKQEGEVIELVPPRLYNTPIHKTVLSKSAIVRAMYSYTPADKKAFSITEQGPINGLEVRFAEYFYQKIKEYQELFECKIIVVIDGDRTQLNENTELNDSKRNTYNEKLVSLGKRYQIKTLDLDKVFQSDFKRNKSLLNFESDSHWNEHCHQLVAETVFKLLMED